MNCSRQMLGDLEDRFNSLESGSRSMVDQVSVFDLPRCGLQVALLVYSRVLSVGKETGS